MDELSQTITDLQEELEASALFDDQRARQGVLRAAIPRTLLDKAGYDTASRYLLVDVSTITPLVDLLVGDVSGSGREPPKPSP